MLIEALLMPNFGTCLALRQKKPSLCVLRPQTGDFTSKKHLFCFKFSCLGGSFLHESNPVGVKIPSPIEGTLR